MSFPLESCLLHTVTGGWLRVARSHHHDIDRGLRGLFILCEFHIMHPNCSRQRPWVTGFLKGKMGCWMGKAAREITSQDKVSLMVAQILIFSALLLYKQNPKTHPFVSAGLSCKVKSSAAQHVGSSQFSGRRCRCSKARLQCGRRFL